jgi:2-polyprenyl-6-methoxyphenol hydroxylase-like FAD-dependent oxidoreductase
VSPEIEVWSFGAFGPSQADKVESRNWCVRRQDAWRILYNDAIECGVEISFGMPVRGVDKQRAAVLLGDGSSIGADLIVGADGMHSLQDCEAKSC